MCYVNPQNATCEDVLTTLYACIQRVVPDVTVQDKTGEQFRLVSKCPADCWFAYEDVGDFVFEGEDLTWVAVDKACGASKSAYATRGSTLRKETPGTSRNN